MSQVHLEEVNQTNIERDTLGRYKNDNGIVTVPYDVVEYIKQDKATTSVDIQKTTSNVFEGIITLSPSIDTFYDTSKPPKMVIDS